MTRFKGKPAIDPQTNLLVKDGSGQVYAVTDTAFATPLEVTDTAGLPLATISTGPLGIHQDFDTVADHLEVVWKSGPYTVTLESSEGIAAAAAASAAQPAADAAAAETEARLTSTFVNKSEAVSVNDATVNAVLTDPASAASASLSATYAGVSQLNVTPATPSATIQTWLETPGAFGVKRLTGEATITATLTPPSGTHLDATDATLTLNTTGSAEELLGIVGVSDVTIVGGVWDANQGSYAGVTQFRHGINVVGSSRVTLRDLTVRNAKGDGIYIGDDSTPTNLSRDVTLTRVRATGCTRNGLAITAAVGVRVSDSTFDNQSGQHPMAGLDIEANLADTVVDDLQFTNCRFVDNAQYGAMVTQPNTATARQGGITFTNCAFDGNGGANVGNGDYGVRLHGATNVKFVGGQIRANFTTGVQVTAADHPTADVSFVGVEIAENGNQGIWASGSVARFKVVGCQVRGNSAGAPGVRAGMQFDTGTDLTVIGTTSTGLAQSYGLITGAGMSRCTVVGNDFTGNTTGTSSLSDEVVTRVALGQSGISTPGAFDSARAAAADTAFSAKVTGDTQPRFLARAEGDLRWGDGATVPDVRLYRSAVDTLRTNDKLVVDQSLTVSGEVVSSRTASGDVSVSAKVAGDAQPRFLALADGDMRWGDGTTAGDTRLYRSGADSLRTNDNFTVDQALTVSGALLSGNTVGAGFWEPREQTSPPAAPGADRARIWVRDNGAGKTQLVVQFATGAVQVIATEP